VVSPAHKDAIDRVSREDTVAAHRVFFPTGLSNLPIGPKWERIYNLLWQRAVLITARAANAVSMQSDI
jgi:hypothetical protein